MLTLIIGCSNAFFEKDTKVKLVEGSDPPTFELSGNGVRPVFLVWGPFDSRADMEKMNKDTPPLMELDVKPGTEGQVITKYSPFVYGKIPPDYYLKLPSDGKMPSLIEGKFYSFYVYVLNANGGGDCFLIQQGKAVN